MVPAGRCLWGVVRPGREELGRCRVSAELGGAVPEFGCRSLPWDDRASWLDRLTGQTTPGLKVVPTGAGLNWHCKPAGTAEGNLDLPVAGVIW